MALRASKEPRCGGRLWRFDCVALRILRTATGLVLLASLSVLMRQLDLTSGCSGRGQGNWTRCQSRAKQKTNRLSPLGSERIVNAIEPFVIYQIWEMLEDPYPITPSLVLDGNEPGYCFPIMSLADVLLG